VTPSRDHYDAVVIGAGPAGSVAAREIARQGKSVLLVDKATFPRRKVCGCCLNGNALAALAAVGLGELPARLDAVSLRSLKLAADGRSATVPIAGVSLSREAFDMALIREAVTAGAELLPGCKATMGAVDGNTRRVFVGEASVLAGIVIAADGLNGRVAALANGFDVPAKASSRIGAGVVVDGHPDYQPGSIFMATGGDGYVGLVVLEDGRLDIAAAFDTGFVRAADGLGEAAMRTLAEAGFPAIAGLQSADWKGTPALTRTPDRIAGERWFAVGDASGYVEPFTGEGMAWAIGGAAAVARLAADGWQPSLIQKWSRLHFELIGRRQRFCRMLAPALRSRLIRRMMVSALSLLPVLARPFVNGLNRPPALSPEPAR
jgi:flavin-dependent dehydrogenase